MLEIPGYEILDDLGGNSWGRAFRARQVSLDRTVYLTLLDAFDASRPLDALSRACAAIAHPHLVSGIDLGVVDGTRYLVTEWVEGPTVGDLLRRGGAMAEERALEVALAVAQAVDCAGRKALVHGNLNPEAIVITNGGNPKVRAFGPDRESARCDRDYRSPEQKRGQPTDIRSDIYSLGLVLHIMLTGEYPFDGAPPPEVVAGEVVESPVALLARSRRLAPETIEIAERMVAWRPDDRPRDGAALVEGLERALTRLDERAHLRPVRPARPTPAVPSSAPRPIAGAGSGKRRARPTHRRRRRR